MVAASAALRMAGAGTAPTTVRMAPFMMATPPVVAPLVMVTASVMAAPVALGQGLRWRITQEKHAYQSRDQDASEG